MKETVESSRAPAPIGPYSQAIADAGLLFMSGQVGRKHDVTALEDGVAKQTRQAIHNLQAVLAERALSLPAVVKTTVFLVDMEDFSAMNTVYIEMFGEDAAPARSTIEVSRLPLDALVEIDAIAVLRQ
ncbi:MAG: Rid family detoxifying hydrolase [Candidatus Poseidoniia archaeon]|jgi:2-iminobutanoate/2-iminopropanoate deaminase|nr:reactive intermediate/imine deaminase [Euryarchaeota archaeon]MDP6489503.1 Rid family detoxifying hydrolase [Candidatus Poseidoniia archaeon]MDP6534193.1 Rid family detoxifying hydrolase [Candidatus Poseidoniia archaeon]MDP6835403.1 Rid family detoxifying hydrolase [Candidatus Poseidoniia archaeon]HIH79251.1 reactive intermediate/imine deaminase [Candidatus Poseidoniia archaeon]|tara:strand:+ start:450 stop:833 length:384 start_codon:yes stop_codon:yes gene_type:complete